MGYYESHYRNEMPPRNRGYRFALISLVTLLVLSNVVTYNFTKKIYSESGSGTFSLDPAGDRLAIDYINKILYLRSELRRDFLFGIDDEEALWIEAVKGFMNGAGDVYTTWMTASEYKSYSDSTSGVFEGIGVQITNNEDNRNVEITKVFKDSPAMGAGMQIGDQIISADGVDLTGQPTEAAVALLRGPSGTSVTVGILRPGQAETLFFEVKRAKITDIFVTTRMMDANIGYIYLSQFGDNAARDFVKEADILLSQGARGLIFDLRQNPGGGVLDALTIADYFLGEGEIIYTLDKSGNRVVSRSDAAKTDVPLVLLIDENSASASEIVAGALKDADRATLVGVKSYGKGIIQRLYSMKDGSLYKITIQEYYVPSGTKIHGIGITPDIAVEMPKDLKNKSVETLDPASDPQLQKAVEKMKELLGY